MLIPRIRGSFLVLFLIFLDTLCSITWLGLYRYARHKTKELDPFNPHECEYSRYNFGLRRRHYRFCRNRTNKFVMHAVVKSAQAVVSYCPQIFKDSRWNCSTVEYLPHVTSDLKRGTREQAVVYAMASGALLFEISRRCAMDRIANCPCGKDSWSIFEPDARDDRNVMFKSAGSQYMMKKHQKTFQETRDSSDQYIWNGCADNVQAAGYFSKVFLGYKRMKNQIFQTTQRFRRRRRIYGHPTSRIWRRDVVMDRNATLPSDEEILRAINGHNYAAGIEIMEKNRRITCKCHGLSGSCTQKVCFRQLLRLDARDLQEAFKRHYSESKYVNFDPITGGFVVKDFQSENFLPKPLVDSDLAFIKLSPDYCDYNSQLGSYGTQNRLCAKYKKGKKTEKEFDACQKLCCNRSTYERVIPKKVSCDCQMDSNFHVQCKECVEKEVLLYCR